MDYFNDDERSKQIKFSMMRDRILRPVVILLSKSGVRPNQVSIAGVVLLLIGCALTVLSPIFASFCVAAYVLCDGIDGPLARYSKTSSEFGSLVDIVCDQVGVVAIASAGCFFFASGLFAAALVTFSAFYISSIAMIVYANNIGIKLPVFVRSKYVFFVLYCLSAMFQPMIVVLEYFTYLFALYYVYLFVDVMCRIGRERGDV